MDERRENIVMEDGRMAERRTHSVEESGEVRHITELYVEEPRDKHLAKRIIEVERPMVVERHVETVNMAGEVVSRTKETVGGDEMQMVENIGLASDNVSAQSMDDCDCSVTREELQEALIAAMRVMHNHDDDCADNCGEVSAMQAVVADRVEPKKSNSMGLVLWAVIVAQVTALGYVVFMM